MKTKFLYFLGIDVSKNKIDVCLIVGGHRGELHYASFEQSLRGYKALKKWLIEKTAKGLLQLVVCVENTGLYDDALLEWLVENKIAVVLENAANIKSSIRDKRQKNDTLDSRHIAFYLLTHIHELELWQKPRQEVRTLKMLLTQRASLVESLKRIKVLQKGMKTLPVE
jgi:transposase